MTLSYLILAYLTRAKDTWMVRFDVCNVDVVEHPLISPSECDVDMWDYYIQCLAWALSLMVGNGPGGVFDLSALSTD